MLVHADWPTHGEELIDPAADREMTWVISLIENIRSARAQVHVPAGSTFRCWLSIWMRRGAPRGPGTRR